jgi:DNA mismatch repair protein MutS
MTEMAERKQSLRAERPKTGDKAARGTPARDSDLVPSRQQYLDLKARYPRAILLYRLGDFYETFDDDARIVARDLRITLTTRSFGRSGRVPMAGIPHHALNHYLARLLAHGHTIAIAEQLTEAGRGLVERGVTRVLTPGTVADAALLPAGENRFLAAIAPRGDRCGLAWVDVSTGEFALTELGGPDGRAQLAEELARLGPAECLVPDDVAADLTEGLPLGHPTRVEHWHFEPERAGSVIREQFGVRSLAAFGCESLAAATGAAGAILTYLGRANPALLPLLTGLRTELPARRVGVDPATRRNLELTRGLRSGGRRGSLLEVLDQTRTAMGARALRRMVGEPRRDLDEPRRRQGTIAALVAHPQVRAALTTLLPRVGDLERLTGRVAQSQAGHRDYLNLAAALGNLPGLRDCLLRTGEAALSAVADGIGTLADVKELVESAVEDDADAGARVRPGYSAELDAAIHDARDTRTWLAGLERVERERTGIRSLKVGFNKVFGYYIEVTRPNLSLVPTDYHRKQTIAGGERFVTAPLKDAEARILAADEEIAALEREALTRLARDVAQSTARLLATAGRLAELDALASLAEVAARGNWVRPALEEGDVLTIVGGRHPVVEANLAGESFIPNDCRLGGAGARILLVTGPNMGGKSTYLRQVALIVLLAQIGSFVPAAAARIGRVDRIFTRVGAQDDLAGGASTFMVEMVETATILHQATRDSLIVLDEVGRGTSTFDGLAIARAVVEDIHYRIGARTLFATHYLELTALADHLPGLANAHVAALETGDRVVFLYALRPGAAGRAYGIQVARLAGLPPWVADRAASLLTDLEAGPAPGVPRTLEPPPRGYEIAEGTEPVQLAFSGLAAGPGRAERLARELAELDLASLTPRQALEWLFERQAHLR